MHRIMCRAKIHRATVTRSDIHYEGSLSVDAKLLKLAGIAPFERVQVVNLSNGKRFETYIIAAKSGSGTIGMNGGAVYYAGVGDMVIIIAYGLVPETELKGFKPRVVLVNARNRPVRTR